SLLLVSSEFAQPSAQVLTQPFFNLTMLLFKSIWFDYRIDRTSYFSRLSTHPVMPLSKRAVSIHRRYPTLRRLLLNFSERIVPFGFQDQMNERIGAQSNNKVRHIVMRLSVMKVRNRKS